MTDNVQAILKSKIHGVEFDDDFIEHANDLAIAWALLRIVKRIRLKVVFLIVRAKSEPHKQRWFLFQARLLENMAQAAAKALKELSNGR